MLIYLDLCCFNRPFDDQTQARIHLETEAKLIIQQYIRDCRHELIWSHILQYENSLNPFIERRDSIAEWSKYASVKITHSIPVVNLSIELMKFGIKEYDALHVAAAITAQAELFITTDDSLIKKLKMYNKILCLSPLYALAYLENWYEN